MKLWIARNQDGSLALFRRKKPKLFWEENIGQYWVGTSLWLHPSDFPEITFENSPQEVELTLCNHIDTVNIRDCNPKKQTCVLTNHGIVTDVIFKDN